MYYILLLAKSRKLFVGYSHNTLRNARFLDFMMQSAFSIIDNCYMSWLIVIDMV